VSERREKPITRENIYINDTTLIKISFVSIDLNVLNVS